MVALVQDSSTRLRADKWLWFARVVKTRSLASGLIKSGKVKLNGDRISLPSRLVAVGDVLTITLDRRIRILKIKAIAARRGPASEAQLTYSDLSPLPVKRDPKLWPAKQAVREEGAGRPTKKERRQISRFKSNAGEEF